jgi:hypothetical protein
MYLGQGMGAAQSVRKEDACRHPSNTETGKAGLLIVNGERKENTICLLN